MKIVFSFTLSFFTLSIFTLSGSTANAGTNWLERMKEIHHAIPDSEGCRESANLVAKIVRPFDRARVSSMFIDAIKVDTAQAKIGNDNSLSPSERIRQKLESESLNEKWQMAIANRLKEIGSTNVARLHPSALSEMREMRFQFSAGGESYYLEARPIDLRRTKINEVYLELGLKPLTQKECLLSGTDFRLPLKFIGTGPNGLYFTLGENGKFWILFYQFGHSK